MKNNFKKMFLVFSLIFSLNIFANGNTTMAPVSIQRIANASLTCPAGKWCEVVVNAYVDQQPASTGACSISNGFRSFNVKLKSGEVISATKTFSSGSIGIARSYITISVGGVIISTVSGTFTCATGGTASAMSIFGDYAFYSMEYWN